MDVTYNGSRYDALIAEGGYPEINGKRVDYVATTDYTDEKTGVEYKKNIDEIVDAYGSYLPKEGLDKPILYIVVE